MFMSQIPSTRTRTSKSSSLLLGSLIVLMGSKLGSQAYHHESSDWKDCKYCSLKSLRDFTDDVRLLLLGCCKWNGLNRIFINLLKNPVALDMVFKPPTCLCRIVGHLGLLLGMIQGCKHWMKSSTQLLGERITTCVMILWFANMSL